jgi:hypothetical protein
MNLEKQYIARVIFKNRVLSSHGQVFEDLFVRVMQASDKDFRPVKPQGREGDKKNDGFNKVKGQYYQVYSPENVLEKEKESYKKLDTTFDELYDYWQPISPIKEFYWVYNDKFQTGVYPSIEKSLADIEQKYKIKANPFLSKDLEDVFLSLPESEIIDILGYLPDHNCIEDVELSVLGEVIKFLIQVKFNPNNITFPNDINFDKKIRFNKLSTTFANILKSAFHQDFIITEYFKYNSKFAKENLKTVFSGFYKDASVEISGEFAEKADLVFEYILDKARPRNNMAVTNAVLTLMAHYFESCDIYEEPVEPIQNSLF